MIITPSPTIFDSALINPGVVLGSDIANDTITNANIKSDAAIAGSKLGTDIVNANIGASAAIVDTKLAQITTASKVSGAALTSLASIPAGAGVIPSANLPASGGLQMMGSNVSDPSTSSSTLAEVIAISGMSIADADWLLIKATIHKGAANNSASIKMLLGGVDLFGTNGWIDGFAAAARWILTVEVGPRNADGDRQVHVRLAGHNGSANVDYQEDIMTAFSSGTITTCALHGQANDNTNPIFYGNLRVYKYTT